LENQLQKYFGFTSFKKGQKEVIFKIMKGQSAAAIFPTGAGKSLCYQFARNVTAWNNSGGLSLAFPDERSA